MADKIIIDEKIIEPVVVKPIVGEVIKKIDNEVFVTTITKVDLTPLTDRKEKIEQELESFIAPTDEQIITDCKEDHPLYIVKNQLEEELEFINLKLLKYED